MAKSGKSDHVERGFACPDHAPRDNPRRYDNRRSKTFKVKEDPDSSGDGKTLKVNLGSRRYDIQY